MFIRFFDNRDNTIPNDSIKLGHKSRLNSNPQLDHDVFIYITDWMTRNPNGKVDFLWASAAGIM